MFMRTNKLKPFWVVIAAATTLFGCSYATHRHADDWGMTADERNASAFRVSHHYGENSNFQVVGDSLLLRVSPPLSNAVENESEQRGFMVYHGDLLVVADVAMVRNSMDDSVWVEVARDQQTIGWVGERCLLQNVVPDAPLSQFIYWYRGNIPWVLCSLLLVVGAFVVLHFVRKDVALAPFDWAGSVYPALFFVFSAGAGIIRATIAEFRPDDWAEFYFNVSINPFGLPFLTGLFVAMVWSIVLLAVASADVVFHRYSIGETFVFMLSLLAVSFLSFVAFTFSEWFAAAVPCFVALVFWTFMRCFRSRNRYACGRCGSPMNHGGRCQRCGAINQE